MTTNIPVLPVAGAAVVRAALSVLAFVTRWLKAFARARRHRREAAALAGLDRRMLADIGISRSDVSDAFLAPFWQDPTALLRERAGERRVNSDVAHQVPTPSVQQAFGRPPAGRRLHYTI
jgi:uncharacterized protein YjiS (DUF1127 family)